MIDRDHPIWPIEFCRDFFDLQKGTVEAICNSQVGSDILFDLWDHDPKRFYENPIQILRQEAFHCAKATTDMTKEFWDNVPQDSYILNYGCGTAELGRKALYDNDASVVLSDISETTRGYLKAKYADRENVSIVNLSFFYPPPTEIFDVVICTDVFEHVPNPLELLEELTSFLSPGGQALFSFSKSYPHAGHLKEAIDQYDEWVVQIKMAYETIRVFNGHYFWGKKRDDC